MLRETDMAAAVIAALEGKMSLAITNVGGIDDVINLGYEIAQIFGDASIKETRFVAEIDDIADITELHMSAEKVEKAEKTAKTNELKERLEKNLANRPTGSCCIMPGDIEPPVQQVKKPKAQKKSRVQQAIEEMEVDEPAPTTRRINRVEEESGWAVSKPIDETALDAAIIRMSTEDNERPSYIAKALGVPLTKVFNVLRSLDDAEIDEKPTDKKYRGQKGKRIPDDVKAEVIRLKREEGKSCVKISKILGISKNSAQRIITEANQADQEDD